MSSLAADPYAMGALEKPPAEAGVAPARVEANERVVTEAQFRAIAQAAARDEITKRAASKTEFGALREDFKDLRGEFKALANDVAALDKRVDVGFASLEAKFNMLLWFVGIGIVVTVVPVIAAAVKIILG